jgi:Flp pilus assembly protein TadB
MGALDRFRRLERVRREHAADAPPPEPTLDRFREPPPPLAPRDPEREQREQSVAAREERERAEQQEIERWRVERERKIESWTRGSDVDGVADLEETRPLIALLRATGRIANPWLRGALQIAMIGGFVWLVVWSVLEPGRYGVMLLLLALLGVVPRWRRRRRWR